MIINYKNCQVHYTIEGEGSPVVLLHGFLENLKMWQPILPALTKTHQVISIDLLGHGETECLGYVHRMETMADVVLAVLQHEQVEKAHFIGHSMGAYVALALAEQQPELFKGLCLMNSTFEADTPERQQIRTRACKMAQHNYQTLIELSFANLFSEESKTKYKEAYQNALNEALQTPLQGYIAAQEGMKLRPNRLEVFKNLEGQQLIIAGKKDQLINREQILKTIEGSRITYVEFSEGHMSYIENKKELTYNVLQFIEK